MDDLISRQAAIDTVGNMLRRKFGIGGDLAKITLAGLPPAQPALDEWCTDCKEYDQERHCCPRWNRVIRTALDDARKELSPAQPEPLTDKEQRIFLAAMAREEKVCEEVDRNHVREPYEDSLMRVCKEIRRKVKGALWT